MVRRFFLSAVFLAATLLPASAQHRATVISQHYTTAEGLPSNNVMCVLKDRDGFLWFGTWYGLCRFDGTEFSAYNKPRNPNTDFPPRKVESMAEDAEGQLWLKTVDWRLYVFNRHTERFQAVSQQLKKYTKNLQIIKIQRTNEGRILLLCKDKTLLEAYTDKLGNIHISKLFDSKGKIHPQTMQLYNDVATTSQNQFIYIGRDYKLFTMRKKGHQTDFTTAMSNSDSLLARQQHRLTAIAQEAGISKYSSLYQDSDSLLWVTTNNEGIYCISKPPQWFSLIDLPDDDQTGVRCIYQTRQGYILVSTRRRDVYLYNAHGQLLQTLPYSRYGIGAVYHATEDRRGRLWVPTKGDGLVVVHAQSVAEGFPANMNIRHYCHDPSNPKSISGNNVYMTFIDSKQHIWVGTLDGGLNLVQEQTDGQLTFYHKQHGLTHYPAYGLYTEVRNMAEDEQGHLYVGTIDGLMTIDTRFKKPSDIRFHTYRDDPQALFANNDIYTLHRDHTGQLWVGTFGGGLQRLTADGHFMPLSAREGLRNDVIYAITEDLRGQLWLSTEGGLSCYNSETQRVRNFDRYDGIPDVKMEEAAATRLSNGDLWIGCKEGILTFNPEQLQTGSAHYRTYIIDLVADNASYQGATAISFADQVELNYDHNAFTVEFAALNYLNRGNVNYRYRLEGFDRDWRYSGPHRVGSYNEVPPGNYTFIVETIDDANPDLVSSARLSIRILPPWWATWWAYLIYICIVALITWLVVRTILQMNRMRNEIYISQRLAKLTSKPDDGDEFIDRLHRIIRQNISNGDFVIDDLAEEMSMSRSAFYKKVKRQTGFAPVDLIKEFRLSHAAELLQTTNHSITEIAYRSGFRDPGYFGKCFRKRFGMTPREYTNQHPPME